jgi:TPR repeat protein
MKSIDLAQFLSTLGVDLGNTLPEEFEPSQLEELLDSKDATIQFAMGSMYQVGPDDLEQDPIKSAIWFRRSAEQGHARAQALLARLHLHGEGVPLSYAEAYQWSRKSSEQGDRLGELLLAVCLKEGFGVPQAPEVAFEKLRKLAEQGDANAMVLLSVMLAKGEGVHRDNLEAYVWANVAAALGDGDGNELRDSFKGLISREALIGAQQKSLELFERTLIALGKSQGQTSVRG